MGARIGCDRRSVVRLGLLLLGLGLLGAALATPAVAQTDIEDDGPRVVLTGRVEVAADEQVDAVVIFDGPAVIDGTVDGSVVAFNGEIVVRGDIDDDVVAFNGRAIVETGATVGGDVLSQDRPAVAEGARVDGDVRRVNFSNWFRSLGWVLWLGWWLAVTVSLFVFGVLLLALVPRIFPPILEVARTLVGPVILWGLIATIGLPIACAIVMVTLVGIPLGLIGLLSLALVYSLGFVIASLTLGRRLLAEPRSVYLAFFVGFIILRVVGLIPVLGALVTMAAIVYGVGALTIAAWRAGRGHVTHEPQPSAAV
ncbi:MAG: hypothetical protein ACRDV7_12215 [Acidimicrobiia bacterium]